MFILFTVLNKIILQRYKFYISVLIKKTNDKMMHFLGEKIRLRQGSSP